MKTLSMSILLFGLLSLCASDRPEPVNLELVTAAVAACNVAREEDGWASIKKEADAAAFAGMLVEYQVTLDPAGGQREMLERSHSYVLPGFVNSFFGFMFPDPQQSRRARYYEVVPFSKVNRPKEDHEFMRDLQQNVIERCSLFYMRKAPSEALPAIKDAISKKQGAFQGTAAFAYREDIEALLAGTTD